MSLYITSHQLSHDTYTQLITAASSRNGFVYYNKKADTYCVSEESLENYKRVSGQRIYELGRKFKTAFNENPEQAKDVSGSLRYFKNLTLKHESERNPLLRLIVKIYQAIRNLFYGYGLRTPATLLDRFASELDAAAETSLPLPEKKIKENESPPPSCLRLPRLKISPKLFLNRNLHQSRNLHYLNSLHGTPHRNLKSKQMRVLLPQRSSMRIANANSLRGSR